MKTVLSLTIALWIGATTGLPASGRADFTLKNETLELGFDTARQVLVSMKDPRTGHEFLESLPESPVLWTLEMEKPDGTPFSMRSSMTGKRRVERSSKTGEVTLHWTGLEVAGEKNAMDVRVIVSLPGGADRSYWRIEVDNKSKCSLMHVQFPTISGLSKPGQPDVAVPRHNWGNLERNVTFTRGSYPCDIWPMQFLALLEEQSGLYLAYEDPRSSFKFFDLKPGEYFSFTTFAENATQPGNDFVSPGPAAIGVCGPDWWKAAKMYRQWAVRQQWTSRGPLTGESNVPEAAKRVGIWFNEILAAPSLETQLEQIEAGRAFYQLPMAMQLYTWHRPAFDTEYPDYFPARAGFSTVVEALTSVRALVAPYVNGRLQDLNVPSAGAAAPWMVKKRDGKPHVEDYQSGAKLAVMCPATAYWQKVMFETARTLVEDYGVNGIYYDQIAAAEQIMCYDPSHGHPVGGGSHWVEGYRTMLQKVKELRTKEGSPLFVATENNAECYMDTADAFLTWTPRHPSEIPLLTAVYSGYTLYFGSNAQVEDDGELQAFAMIVGRDLLWGTQPGWMAVDVTSERGTYLRDVARVRHAGLRFFQFGELLGEVKPLQDPGTVTGRWKNINRDGAEPTAVTLPAVMSTVWKSADGALGVAVANLSGKEKSFSYRIKPADFGVGEKETTAWTVRQIRGDSEKPLGDAQGDELVRDEKLNPWEFRLIEIKPAG